MKHILSTLILFTISTSTFSNVNVLESINKLNQQIDQQIILANKCLPEINGETITLCAGDKIKFEHLDTTAISKDECFKKISEKKFKIITEANSNSISKELWNSFFKTTKLAETIHQSKIVFFKKEADRYECLHELFHIKQFNKRANKPLAPNYIKNELKDLKTLLLKGTKVSESIQKRGDKVQLNKAILSLQNGIEHYKRLESLNNWLTEKEAYYFFYKHCAENECSSRIKDIIISNLATLKDHFPWRFKNEISRSADALLKSKEIDAVEATNFKPFTDNDKKQIEALANNNWTQLLNEKRSIQIAKYPIPVKLSDSKDTIPTELFESLRSPTPIELGSLLSFSKTENITLGKYICGTIFLSNGATRGTFIHEYIHHLQSRQNPTYCDALTKQSTIADNFSSGKLGRADYEHLILSYKAMIWKSEYETYEFLSQKKFDELFSGIEHDNNVIQAIIYKEKLNRHTLEAATEIENNTTIVFEERDNLPLIKINNESLVFDLGAMRSVIKPSVLITNYNLKNSPILKSIQLRNVLNELLTAPQIQLIDPINIGGTKFKNTKWVLANLKLPYASGLLGADFFKNSEISIFPKEGRILFTKFKSKPSEALLLQLNFDGTVHAVEVVCPKGVILRLDSGSQVRGDKLPEVKNPSCGKMTLDGPFSEELPANSAAFDHDVTVNLGWPWIKEFNRVDISFKDGWIQLVK